MTTSAITVANEFLRLANERGAALTPLQLMKLVYIAHGWMLALYQRPLITNRIEAWKYGPVIPDLYSSIKGFGSGSVIGPLRHGIFSRPADLEDEETWLIEQVYKVYGDMSGIKLSSLTHKTGTPWATTYQLDGRNIPISNDLILDHYQQLSREREPAEK